MNSPNKVVSAAFAVNIEHLHALGVVDPYSEQSLQLYHSGKLNANERLYFSLWGSSELSTSLIRARTRFAKQGEPVSSAYFIIKGAALGVKDDEIYRLGPGSVIGLAEGVTLGSQLVAQFKGATLTLVYTAVVSYILLKIVDVIIGLRVTEEQETEGLDIALHDERGYNL